jgi:hypothetical protein
MNEATWALVTDVVRRVQQAVEKRQAPAIVILDGARRLILSDYDYLRDQDAALAFEVNAAERAQTLDVRHFAFAVPQVVVSDEPGSYAARAVSNHPLRPGEQETIVWTGFDRANGVYFGVAPFSRRPGGRPVFDEPTTLDVPLRAEDRMPGVRLLRALTAS